MTKEELEELSTKEYIALRLENKITDNEARIHWEILKERARNVITDYVAAHPGVNLPDDIRKTRDWAFNRTDFFGDPLEKAEE
jgi:hypothetical protein